jgi:hypothetical protein
VAEVNESSPSPRSAPWYLKARKATAIIVIVAAGVLFVTSAWRDQWAAAAVWLAAMGMAGGALRYQREAQCPNNQCHHDYTLHARNLSNEWVCKFDGCFCGKQRLPEPDIF